MSDDPALENVEQLAGEVRALREHLRDLIERMQDERASWHKTLTHLPDRPRLTASQRTRFRRYVEMLVRRRTP